MRQVFRSAKKPKPSLMYYVFWLLLVFIVLSPTLYCFALLWVELRAFQHDTFVVYTGEQYVRFIAGYVVFLLSCFAFLVFDPDYGVRAKIDHDKTISEFEADIIARLPKIFAFLLALSVLIYIYTLAEKAVSVGIVNYVAETHEKSYVWCGRAGSYVFAESSVGCAPFDALGLAEVHSEAAQAAIANLNDDYPLQKELPHEKHD